MDKNIMKHYTYYLIHLKNHMGFNCSKRLFKMFGSYGFDNNNCQYFDNNIQQLQTQHNGKPY